MHEKQDASPPGVPRNRCRGRGCRRSCPRGAGRDRGRAAKAPERVLSFFNTHTGERLKTDVLLRRRVSARRARDLNHILRDFRANEIKPIDPRVFDLLHELGGTLETDQPFHIISGYRSPQTNAMLRERGGAPPASRRTACTWSARRSTSASPA